MDMWLKEMRTIKTTVSDRPELANSDPFPSLSLPLERKGCSDCSRGLHVPGSSRAPDTAQSHASTCRPIWGTCDGQSLGSSTLRGGENKLHFHPKWPELFDLISLLMKPMLCFTTVFLPVYLTNSTTGRRRGGTRHLGMGAIYHSIRPPTTL